MKSCLERWIWKLLVYREYLNLCHHHGIEDKEIKRTKGRFLRHSAVKDSGSRRNQ